MFPETQWSLVQEAQHGSPTALGRLLEAYRPAMVRYLAWRLERRDDLRARGRYLDDPEGIFQGFIEALLRREFLRQIAPSEGKLRTFLLRAMDHFLADEIDRIHARKGGGRVSHESRDQPRGDGDSGLDVPSAEPPPDRAFDRAWAESLLDRAVERLAARRSRRGQDRIFEALRPFLWGDGKGTGYADVAARLSTSEETLRVTVHRLRHELRDIILDEIRQTVASEADFDDERRHFLAMLRT